MGENQANVASGRFVGALLGMAVGDALGLPREGLDPRRARRVFGDRPLRHQFVLGRGMVSDDTEHACLTAQALAESAGDVDRFARCLARRLRWWLVGLPAGVGFATLRGICKLWLGFSPANSGVPSAGNGPAMRAPVIGLYAGSEPDLLRRLVRVSTRMTHTDERAEQGALIIARGCYRAMTASCGAVHWKDLLPDLRRWVTNEAMLEALDVVGTCLAENLPADATVARLGLSRGVTGYIVHTVAMSLYCWLRNPTSFRDAVEDVILLGGDTDTTGAITGALAGATLGVEAIPPEWMSGLMEWPRSREWMRRLACLLAEQSSRPAGQRTGDRVPLFWPGIVPRNIFFTGIVLFHGLRRLLPPY